MRLTPLLCTVLLVACDAGASAASAPDAAADAESVAVDAGDPRAAFEPRQDARLPFRCALGISPPGSEGGFEPLAPGGVIPIAGVGQAGLTARPAVRIAAEDGEPTRIESAIVELVLVNLHTQVTAPSKPFDELLPFDCRDDGACYRGPVFVEISHLARLPELEGLPVGVEVELIDEAGDSLCRARSHGVLDTL